MYDHHISSMVELLKAELQFDVIHEEIARSVLGEYWKDKIAVVWTAEDVIGIAKHDCLSISRQQAIEILKFVLDHHDAEEGINWDTLSMSVSEYLRRQV